MIKKYISCITLLIWMLPVLAQTTLNKEYKSIKDIPTPTGYTRTAAPPNSFASYLRSLPLKQTNNTVMLYNGSPKGNQTAQYAVVKMDIGKRDLQQCADAIMRLRAEYLRSEGNADKIHFNFTSGHRADYKKYVQGYRPIIKGSKVSWTKKTAVDTSYKGFRKYMDMVFMYAGSYSLKKELDKVPVYSSIQAGDIFIQGGFPGHAIIVVDMAVNSKGEKIFMLAQSYMPAQEIHVLLNPANAKENPWYYSNKSDALYTPEWTFYSSDLMRFHNE